MARRNDWNPTDMVLVLTALRKYAERTMDDAKMHGPQSVKQVTSEEFEACGFEPHPDPTFRYDEIRLAFYALDIFQHQFNVTTKSPRKWSDKDWATAKLVRNKMMQTAGLQDPRPPSDVDKFDDQPEDEMEDEDDEGHDDEECDEEDCDEEDKENKEDKDDDNDDDDNDKNDENEDEESEGDEGDEKGEDEKSKKQKIR